MRDLLTPPGHRGPLISAGAVVLAVGVALEQIRISPGAGVQFIVVALIALVFLWLALQGTLDEADPPPWDSVLLVAGLLALYTALLRFADLVGDPFSGDGFPAGTFVWTGVVEAGAAVYAARRRGSGIALLVAAVAWGSVFLSFYDWVFDANSVTPYRWLLLVLALSYSVASLTMRDVRQRFAEQLVNAAGLAILTIAVSSSLFILDVGNLPTFWELVLLAAGLGLVAYAAADRAPGPAYLGVLNLAAFVAYAAASPNKTLLWWPVLLLIVGAAMMLIGLRPRVPLPPPPGTSTSPGDQPLAARSDGET
jgi:hypothetical protein